MTISWINQATVAMARNGTNTHTVNPTGSGGSVVSGSGFTPTAGNLLICVAESPSSATTPSGWTSPSGGSAVGLTALYVWYKTATGTDSFTTTHGSANYPAVFDFYEFPAACTFNGSASATAVAAGGGAGPTLSGLTGSNLVMAVMGQTNASTTLTYSTIWSAGTELVDTSIVSAGTAGYTYSLSYVSGLTASSWSSAATSTRTGISTDTDRLVFAVKQPVTDTSSSPTDWTNHVTIEYTPGSTSQTADPSTGGTKKHGSYFTPTAGRLLVAVYSGGTSATTPSGWTSPSGGSAVGSSANYIWYKTAAGSDTVATTVTTAGYPIVVDFYEFLPGSTFVSAVNSTSTTNGAAGPTLSGLTGSNLVMAVMGQTSNVTTNTFQVGWNDGCREVLSSVLATGGLTNGTVYSMNYRNRYTGSSWAPTPTSTYTVASARLTFAINPVLPTPVSVAALGATNHVTAIHSGNGSTTHTVDSAAPIASVSGTPFAPTAGRLLVCVAAASATSTTPSGWTSPANGSAVSGAGLYVWYKTAAGGDTLTTVHSGTGINPATYDFYEFPAGSALVASAKGEFQTNGAANVTPLTGLTGTSTVFYAAAMDVNANADSANTIFGTGTEIVDYWPPVTYANVGAYGLAATGGYVGSSANSTVTFSPSTISSARLIFAINLAPPAVLGEWGFLDNLNDTSGNGRHGTFAAGSSGGTLTYVPGPQTGTRGVTFGSATNRVGFGRTGLEPAVDGVTAMGWIKVTDTPGVNLSLLSKAKAPASSRYRFGITGWSHNPTFVARWKDDLHNNETVTPALDNTWHHYAVVDGNTRWALYIDGVLSASNNGTRAMSNGSSPTWEAYDWYTGYNPDLGDQYAHNAALSVSGIRIFAGELTADQITAWMNTAITSPAPTITTTTLNGLTVGSVFSQTLVSTGSPTITWAVTSGTLPAGMSLSSGGVLTGTPTTAGAYSFTVTATNSAGSDPQAYVGSVIAVGPTLSLLTGVIPNRVEPEAIPLNLGMRFKSSTGTTVLGVRFYKGSTATGSSHTAALWTDTGTELARADFTGETSSGWQSVLFSTPVAIAANTVYVVSYLTVPGTYAYTGYFFNTDYVNGSLTGPPSTIAAPNACHNFNNTVSFPNMHSADGGNFFVDVIVPNPDYAADSGGMFFGLT